MLSLLLFACSADYPVASVTTESSAPVDLAQELAAYVIEDPSSGDGGHTTLGSNEASFATGAPHSPSSFLLDVSVSLEIALLIFVCL